MSYTADILLIMSFLVPVLLLYAKLSKLHAFTSVSNEMKKLTVVFLEF